MAQHIKLNLKEDTGGNTKWRQKPIICENTEHYGKKIQKNLCLCVESIGLIVVLTGMVMFMHINAMEPILGLKLGMLITL